MACDGAEVSGAWTSYWACTADVANSCGSYEVAGADSVGMECRCGASCEAGAVGIGGEDGDAVSSEASDGMMMDAGSGDSAYSDGVYDVGSYVAVSEVASEGKCAYDGGKYVYAARSCVTYVVRRIGDVVEDAVVVNDDVDSDVAAADDSDSSGKATDDSGADVAVVSFYEGSIGESE